MCDDYNHCKELPHSVIMSKPQWYLILGFFENIRSKKIYLQFEPRFSINNNLLIFRITSLHVKSTVAQSRTDIVSVKRNDCSHLSNSFAELWLVTHKFNYMSGKCNLVWTIHNVMYRIIVSYLIRWLTHVCVSKIIYASYLNTTKETCWWFV